MKRDFDLVRSILLQVEAAPSGAPIMQLSADESIDLATMLEHIEIIAQEGLIEAEVFSGPDGFFSIQKLTWKGHDFLANARNDTAWKHVMGQVKEKGLALTISVISGLLSKEALKAAGL
jgi:hypothetical protein